MSAAVAAASAGFLVAGPIGAVIGGAAPWVMGRARRVEMPTNRTRQLLLVLIVEARSGLSVLAALQAASSVLLGDPDLRRVARTATVAGLTASISVAGAQLRPIVAQLARAQASGASITGALRALLERDLAEERSVRIARARSLPVRLMLPLTLLMLPGLVLLLYAPSLFSLFTELTGSWR